MEKNHLEVLLESMHSKFDAVTELATGMADAVQVLKQNVESLTTDMTEVNVNVHVIKTVVTEQSGELKDAKERLTVLEAH